MDAVLKKLNYKDQDPVLLLDAPAEFKPVQAAFSGNVKTQARGTFDFVMCFATTRAQADALVAKTMKCISEDAVVWLCYPKGTSRKYDADYNRDSCWEIFKPYGLRPVRQVAIDDDWSALRFRPEDKGKK